MASLIRRQGGEPTIAPSMCEAPLEKHEPVFDFWKRLTAGEVHLVILMTGVGTQAMFDVLTSVNRFALIYRTNGVKQAATRQKKIAGFVEMLARHEAPYPQTRRPPPPDA